MNFEQAKAKIRTPGCKMLLPLWVFADDYAGRPDGEICVGLRLLSENDKSLARSLATKRADELHQVRDDAWTDCFNDTLQLQIDALAMCDPNDVAKPPEIFSIPEDQIPFAFTSRGAAHVFRRLQRYEIEVSSAEPLADLSDTKRLAAHLQQLTPMMLAVLSPGPRRLMAYLNELLEPLTGGLVDAAGIDDAPDEVPVSLVVG